MAGSIHPDDYAKMTFVGGDPVTGHKYEYKIKANIVDDVASAELAKKYPDLFGGAPTLKLASGVDLWSGQIILDALARERSATARSLALAAIQGCFDADIDAAKKHTWSVSVDAVQAVKSFKELTEAVDELTEKMTGAEVATKKTTNALQLAAEKLKNLATCSEKLLGDDLDEVDHNAIALTGAEEALAKAYGVPKHYLAGTGNKWATNISGTPEIYQVGGGSIVQAPYKKDEWLKMPIGSGGTSTVSEKPFAGVPPIQELVIGNNGGEVQLIWNGSNMGTFGVSSIEFEQKAYGESIARIEFQKTGV